MDILASCFSGGWIICCSVAMVDLFGIDKVVKCYGAMTIAHAISFLSSSIVHGKREWYILFICLSLLVNL